MKRKHVIGACAVVALAAALGLANDVRAEMLAYAANQADGRIELTSVHSKQCTNGTQIAKAWLRGADDIYGCWYADTSAGTITIEWFLDAGPAYRTYSAEIFTLNPEAVKKAASRKNHL